MNLPSSISFTTECMAIKNAGLYKGIASTIGISKQTNKQTNKKTIVHSELYSSKWKAVLLGLSKIKGAVSPALGHFFLLLATHPYLKR